MDRKWAVWICRDSKNLVHLGRPALWQPDCWLAVASLPLGDARLLLGPPLARGLMDLPPGDRCPIRVRGAVGRPWQAGDSNARLYIWRNPDDHTLVHLGWRDSDGFWSIAASLIIGELLQLLGLGVCQPLLQTPPGTKHLLEWEVTEEEMG